MIELHLTYWIKDKVLYYQSSAGHTGSQPVSDLEERELEKLIKQLGFKKYTLEKI
jgi:hypothetical protein